MGTGIAVARCRLAAFEAGFHANRKLSALCECIATNGATIALPMAHSNSEGATATALKSCLREFGGR